MTDFLKLREPFPVDRISWRVGSTTKDKSRGMALAYIDARDVQDRLDAVVGPENWQNRYPHANGKTVCEIAIRYGDNEWITKSDGAGDSDFEAEKGAMSDAFKRAAVKWGIGRYLYDVPSIWVDLDDRQNIKESEMSKLRKLLSQNGGDVSLPASPPQASVSNTGAPPADGADALANFLKGENLQIPIPGMKTGAPRYEEYAEALTRALNAAPDFPTLNKLWGDNSRNVTYLTQNRPELRREVEALADARSLALAPPQPAPQPKPKGKKK